jgi:hypothetical protein
VDSEVEATGVSRLISKVVKSTTFQIVMMFLVLSNALINASFVNYHDQSDIRRKRIYYFIEVGKIRMYLNFGFLDRFYDII